MSHACGRLAAAVCAYRPHAFGDTLMVKGAHGAGERRKEVRGARGFIARKIRGWRVERSRRYRSEGCGNGVVIGLVLFQKFVECEVLYMLFRCDRCSRKSLEFLPEQKCLHLKY